MRTGMGFLLGVLAVPVMAMGELAFENARAEPCTLSARALAHPTAIRVLDPQGLETYLAQFQARVACRFTVPAGGTARLRMELGPYAHLTLFEILGADGETADCQLGAGATVLNRKGGFGWASWQRLAPGAATCLRRSGDLTGISYRDAPLDREGP